MIKSILDTDEENTAEAKTIAETILPAQTKGAEISDFDGIEEEIQQSEPRNSFEIPADSHFFSVPPETRTEPIQPIVFEDETPTVEISKKSLPLVENLSAPEENLLAYVRSEAQNEEVPLTAENPAFEPPPEMRDEADQTTARDAEDSQPTIFQSDYTPETTAESVRNSGLAYTAAIVLFGSIVFMMTLGWFIGQLIGNQTIGIVGGIVLGAVIGFVQFFRITSSIFKK